MLDYAAINHWHRAVRRKQWSPWAGFHLASMLETLEGLGTTAVWSPSAVCRRTRLFPPPLDPLPPMPAPLLPPASCSFPLHVTILG
jgi:hypothetical protein